MSNRARRRHRGDPRLSPTIRGDRSPRWIIRSRGEARWCPTPDPHAPSVAVTPTQPAPIADHLRDGLATGPRCPLGGRKGAPTSCEEPLVTGTRHGCRPATPSSRAHPVSITPQERIWMRLPAVRLDPVGAPSVPGGSPAQPPSWPQPLATVKRSSQMRQPRALSSVARLYLHRVWHG